MSSDVRNEFDEVHAFPEDGTNHVASRHCSCGVLWSMGKWNHRGADGQNPRNELDELEHSDV